MRLDTNGMELVTGSTGYMGGRLVERLRAEGRPVRALARDAARFAPIDGVEVVEGNLLQAETQYAPVVDKDRRIAGVLSIEVIQEFLSSPEAKVEEHAAVERPHGDA